MSEPLRVEATGETVGEAKWQALRELERLAPGLDKAAVRFEVLAEGARGLLGVGYEPARVAATAELAPAGSPGVAAEETPLAGELRELLGRVAAELGARCSVEAREEADAVVASLTGPDVGLLIGRHGQTLDAIQYLANVIGWREHGDGHKQVVVDAAGYRERRQATLESLARRSAAQARSSGRPVELGPMAAAERRVVHLCLRDMPGVSTRSEGEEPYRHVVVVPE